MWTAFHLFIIRLYNLSLPMIEGYERHFNVMAKVFFYPTTADCAGCFEFKDFTLIF